MRRTLLARKARLRKVKPTLKGTISDKVLDQACRAVVFARDGYKCVMCGGTSHLQWAHVLSRRYKSLRWTPSNSMVLCARDHLHWHHQPVAAVQWWIATYGAPAHALLQHTLQTAGKLDRPLMLLYLQRRLKELERV